MLLTFFISLGYGILCSYLFITGKFAYYVHPDYSWYIGVSGIVLLLLAFITGVRIIQRSIKAKRTVINDFFETHEETKIISTKLHKYFNAALLALPLIIFLLFPPRLLSAATAQNRLTITTGDSGISRENKKASPFIINPEKRSFIDWIRLFSQHPEPENYKGVKANIKGFVLPHKNLPEGYVYLAQFIISCCAADARPITIPLKFNAQKYQITSDQWIQVKGTFEVDSIDGQAQPVLLVEEINPTNIPDEPYAL